MLQASCELGDFDEALAEFRRNRNRDGRQLGPPHLVSVPVERLKDCKVDRKRTADAAAEAIGKEHKAKLENDGFSFRYPLMCEDDPFYLVYFMKGNDIQWIHKFEVFADRLELRWSYDPETANARYLKLLLRISNDLNSGTKRSHDQAGTKSNTASFIMPRAERDAGLLVRLPRHKAAEKNQIARRATITRYENKPEPATSTTYSQTNQSRHPQRPAHGLCCYREWSLRPRQRLSHSGRC